MLYTLAVDLGSSESCAAIHKNGSPRMLRTNAIGNECLLTALACFTPQNPIHGQKEIAVLSNALHELESLRRLTADQLERAKKRTDFIQFTLDLLIAHADFSSGSVLSVCCPDTLDESARDALKQFLSAQLTAMRNSDAYECMRSFTEVQLVPAAVSPIYSLFKCSPATWDAHQDTHYTLRELTQRYLSALLRCILHANPDVDRDLRAADSLRLVLGCPASSEWLSEESRAAYARMAEEAAAALGIENVHADVIPEPYAASLSFINSADHPDIAKGFAVLDAGGITADGIFLKYSSHSMLYPSDSTKRIGGSLIELRALDLLLEQAEIDILDLSAAEYNAHLLYLRRIKEQYFPDRPALPAHSILFTHPNGSKRVEFLPGELFDRALNMPDDNQRSWRDNARVFIEDFVQRCRTSVASCEPIHPADYKIDTLILTGGCSNVSVIPEICRATNAFRTIRQDSNVSTSIARGLSMTIDEASIEKLKTDVLDSARARVESEILVNALTDVIAKHLPAVASEAIQAMTARRTSCDRNRLIAKISIGMHNSPAVIRDLTAALDNYGSLCAAAVLDLINEHAQQRYPGKIPHLNLPTIPCQSFSVDLIRQTIPRVINSIARGGNHPERVHLLSVRQMNDLLGKMTNPSSFIEAARSSIRWEMYRINPTNILLTALTRDALRYLTFHQLEAGRG